MNELLEKLAELEHKQWERFARAVISEVTPQRQARWKKYLVPYDSLDEKGKDLDREQAKRVLKILDDFYGKKD